jgi:hypothetical protein
LIVRFVPLWLRMMNDVITGMLRKRDRARPPAASARGARGLLHAF